VGGGWAQGPPGDARVRAGPCRGRVRVRVHASRPQKLRKRADYTRAMAYSEELAARIREVIGARDGVSERRMFGGIAWMVGGNMACGTLGEDLMIRLDPEDAQRALHEQHVGPMEFTGRPMRGFITVRADGITDDGDLARWIDAGASYAASLPPK